MNTHVHNSFHNYTLCLVYNFLMVISRQYFIYFIFSKADWSDATVVYVSSTCYSR